MSVVHIITGTGATSLYYIFNFACLDMPANQCEHWWGWGKHRFVTPLTLIVLQTYPYESAWTLKGALGLKTKDQSKHPTSITVIVLTDSCLPINVDTGVGGSEEHQPIKTPHVCNFV